MTYKKNYIGKGKRNENINSVVKFTFALEDLQAVAYEYDGRMYVSVETTQMKQADKFGRSHTAWVTEKAETEEAPRETPKKKKGAK
jgi:hypothetical protein